MAEPSELGCPPHCFTKIGALGPFTPEPDHPCDYCGRSYAEIEAEYAVKAANG